MKSPNKEILQVKYQFSFPAGLSGAVKNNEQVQCLCKNSSRDAISFPRGLDKGFVVRLTIKILSQANRKLP